MQRKAPLQSPGTSPAEHRNRPGSVAGTVCRKPPVLCSSSSMRMHMVCVSIQVMHAMYVLHCTALYSTVLYCTVHAAVCCRPTWPMLEQLYPAQKASSSSLPSAQSLWPSQSENWFMHCLPPGTSSAKEQQ